MRGFGELIDDVVKAVRKSDPPTATQAAAIAAHERNRRDPREEMLARIERIASRLEAIVPLPAPAPVPPHEPLPPGAPPPPKLVYTKQQGWHIPSTLTREELASTVPSAETARRLRLAAEAQTEREFREREQAYLKRNGGQVLCKQYYNTELGRLTYIPPKPKRSFQHER
jgi:hypothetical protein